MIEIRVEPTGDTARARTEDGAVRRAYQMMCVAGARGAHGVTANFYIGGKLVRARVTRRDLAPHGLPLPETTVLRRAR